MPTISNLLVSPQASGTFLSLEFKEAAEQAILAKEKTFTAADESGEEITYQLQNKNQQYIIRVQKQTTVNDTYHKPSVKHWLGTDGNGMDMLTRLMYGGRISLMIGFVCYRDRDCPWYYHRRLLPAISAAGWIPY